MNCVEVLSILFFIVVVSGFALFNKRNIVGNDLNFFVVFVVVVVFYVNVVFL